MPEETAGEAAEAAEAELKPHGENILVLLHHPMNIK